MRPRGEVNLATWALVAGVVVALYCGILFGPSYIDQMSVKEAMEAALTKGHVASDEAVAEAFIGRVNAGLNAVGYHYEEDPETGARTEVPGLGLEPENVTVSRNEAAKSLTIAVDYKRVIRLFPTHRYTTLRFRTEKETHLP